MKKINQNKVHIISLGCPKNLVDSEVMGGLLNQAGHKMVDHSDSSDVVIVNTCAFINPAKEEALEEILTLAEEKKKNNPQLRIVVAGCLAQRYGRELLAQIPQIDLLIGTGQVGEIVNHINKLKISDGCSNYCTYCVIPSIRGPVRSRKPDDILKEAEILAVRGIKEIIITAQDTTAYGRDLTGRPQLSALLNDMAKIKGLEWIRLLYAHPARVTTDLLKIINANEKICRYIDLPIQHIDDDILKAMNRKVTSTKIKNIIAQARQIIPGVALRTSLIVGFPGETPTRFNRLLDFVNETKFDHLGVFIYSKEDDTIAANFRSHVSEKEKERRREIIMNEQAAISNAINKTMVGSIQAVLIEGKSDRDDYMYIGRCRRQAPEIDGVTYIKKSKSRIGEIVTCKILAADVYDLFGEIIN